MNQPWVVRVRASTGLGEPVVSWLCKDGTCTSRYVQAVRFASAAEAWDFVGYSGNAGGDAQGAWCEPVPDDEEEAARQMDADTLHRLDNPWLYREAE